MNARVSQLFGGRSGTNTLASATTVYVPDNVSVVTVTGTTTITSLIPSDLVAVNRMVLFIGGAGASVTFTNSETTPNTGDMYLRGSNRVLTEKSVMALYFTSDKTWILLWINS